MNLQIGDNVLIKKSSICDSEPMEEKYIGQKGVIVEINTDRPSPIVVKVDMVGTDGFWEEELEVVNEKINHELVKQNEKNLNIQKKVLKSKRLYYHVFDLLDDGSDAFFDDLTQALEYIQALPDYKTNEELRLYWEMTDETGDEDLLEDSIDFLLFLN